MMRRLFLLVMSLVTTSSYLYAGEAHVVVRPAKEISETDKIKHFVSKARAVNLEKNCIFQHITSPDGPTPPQAIKIIVDDAKDMLAKCEALKSDACPGGVTLGGHAMWNIGTSALLSISHLADPKNILEEDWFPSHRNLRSKIVACFKRISRPLAQEKTYLTFASCTCDFKTDPPHYLKLTQAFANELGLPIRTTRGSCYSDLSAGQYAVCEEGWNHFRPDR